LILLNKYRIHGRTLTRINRYLWNWSPANFKNSRIGLRWGRLILKLVRLSGDGQLTTTYFFRNRSELKLMEKIVSKYNSADSLKLTVVGCSEGAEVFTILYTCHKALPGVELKVSAFDIDEPALNVAKKARFKADSRVLSTLTQEESKSLFDQDGGFLQVKDQFRNVDWYLQDPTEASFTSTYPKQDFVVANRLLFHMDRKEQYRALKAIASMVRPGGYLFVSGVDLEVRLRIVNEFNLQPVPELLEEIHAGDETMTLDWPFQRWGLEPLNKKERNWMTRYCAVFQMPI